MSNSSLKRQATNQVPYGHINAQTIPNFKTSANLFMTMVKEVTYKMQRKKNRKVHETRNVSRIVMWIVCQDLQTPQLFRPRIHWKSVWISRETSFTWNSREIFTWNSCEIHVKFASCEFHVKLSREFHVKLVSREIHVKYFTWIAGESSFTWNSREICTYISREFCE